MREQNGNYGTVWTPRHVEELRGLADSGVPTSVIALHLGRSVVAIRSKAASLGLRVSENIGARRRAQLAQRRKSAD